MRPRLLPFIILMAAGVAAVVARGQEVPAVASAPSTCLKATRDFQQARIKQAGGPVTRDAYAAIQGEKIGFARACIARLALGAVPAGELASLAELYLEAGQPDHADEAIARALDVTGADTAAQAKTLVSAVQLTMRQPKSDARNARAEQYVARLEALPPSFVRERIDGHAPLNNYYRADDIDAGIIRHSTRLIELNASLTPEQRVPQVASVIIAAHEYLAEALAGQEQTPKALDLLRRAPAALPGIAGVAERLAPTIERYELVGKPAPAIEAPTWLNAPAGTSKLDMAGAITWLQFTAHWCGPCREAYPAAVRLQKQFGARGFRVVMATQLYGYFENRRNLAPADELAAIRDYFPQHGIVWPVAVSDNIPPAMEGGRPVRRANVNDANYKVAGIPQIHLIDRSGRIRLIMIGFDEANEPSLAAMIGRLLNESIPPGSGP
jgi:thiol-disulfide isomerase/thioredoxin